MGFKWFSQKGMSLIEVMVTTAVASIIMVAIGNSLISLYQHQANVVHKDEANEFAADFSRLISQNDVCSSMLENLSLPPDTPDTEFSISNYLSQFASASGPDLQAGVNISDGLKVLSLTYRDSPLDPKDDRIDEDLADPNNPLTPVWRQVVEIELRLAIVKANEDQELKPRRFQVPVLVRDSDKRIMGCATELQVTEACTTIGGTYDNNTNSCIPDTTCFMQGAFTTINCTSSDGNGLGDCPSPTLNPITSGQNCPAGALATESGRYDYTVSVNCGKKCTRYLYITTVYYVCLRCD